MKREFDRKLLQSIPNSKKEDFIFMHLRDLWAVDGLYYMGIEKRFGTDIATEIDAFVWRVMGKIEARRIKHLLEINGDTVKDMMDALLYSSWALDLEDKEYEILDDKAIIRNVNCRVQQTRIEKELGEFGCKPVRMGFLQAFADEFNPHITVNCRICPPDDHPKDLWCEWEFSIKES